MDLPLRIAADLLLFAAFGAFMLWYTAEWRRVLLARTSRRRRRRVKFRLVDAGDLPAAMARSRLR